jgi:16S rRNA processing protein RimM
MAGIRDSGSGTRDSRGSEPGTSEPGKSSPECRVPNPDWDQMVLVGRIARPHGLHGQVVINPETDFVEERFRVGAKLWTRSSGGDEQLTVVTMRVQGGRPVVGFEGFATIEDVEPLAGLDLRILEEELQALGEGFYYHHQLVGCVVDTLDGERVGSVVRVAGGSAGSLLEIDGPRGEVLIPLVDEICVEIDVRARRIRVNPPDGLLDVNA